MTHVSGKNGGVYGNSLIIHACEVAWDDTTGGGVVASTTTGKVGTNAARATCTTVGADVMLMSKDGLGPLDLSTYEAAIWWARSHEITVLGAMHLLIDETNGCGTPEEELDWPIMAVNTWKHCFGLFTGVAATRDAIISVGLQQVADLGDGAFDVDDVRAVQEITGIKSWTLEYTVAMLNVTDFESAGVSAFLPGISEWHGTFEGYKDGVPLSIGAEVYLVLGETSVGTEVWLGNVIIMAARPSTDHDGLVSYSYDFQGTEALQAPTT